jgi:hypothetical protein
MIALNLGFIQTVSPNVRRFTDPSSPDFNRNYSGGETVRAADEFVALHHGQLGNNVNLPEDNIFFSRSNTAKDTISIRTTNGADGTISPNDVNVLSSVMLDDSVVNILSFKGSNGATYREKQRLDSSGTNTLTYERISAQATLDEMFNPTQISQEEFETARQATNINLRLSDLPREANGTLVLDQALLDKVADADDNAVNPPVPPPPPPPLDLRPILGLTNMADVANNTTQPEEVGTAQDATPAQEPPATQE